MDIRTQVIVVGAGPTGLSLAVQLLRYNIDCIILEKNAKPTHLSKAIVIQARTLEIFHETRLAKTAIEQGRITNAGNIFYKGKKRAVLNLAGLGEGLTPFPFALSLEQSKTEALLANYLTDKAQTIFWNCEFLGFRQDDKEVTVTYKDPKGIERVALAQYLVGCDGSHSAVRHQAGMTFEGDTIPKMFYIADVTLNSPVICADELFMFLIKKGFILFFPMEGGGHYRIIGILPGHTGETDLTFGDIKEYIGEQVAVPVTFEELRWFSSYKVHSRKANAFMNRRCFIAGDAAHIHTPAGGQGMNTGIQDAYNLGWKLAFVLNGADKQLLETYHTERMENAAHLLRTTDRMFDIMTGSSRFWHFIRLQVFPVIARFVATTKAFNKRIFPLLSQTGIAYPDSSITITSKVGKVKAGDRMHYFPVPDGNIFDLLTEPLFKILYFGNAAHSFEKFRDGVPVVTLSFKEIPKKLFGNETDFYILLRPDNHISFIGKDAEICEKFLRKLKA